MQRSTWTFSSTLLESCNTKQSLIIHLSSSFLSCLPRLVFSLRAFLYIYLQVLTTFVQWFVRRSSSNTHHRAFADIWRACATLLVRSHVLIFAAPRVRMNTRPATSTLHGVHVKQRARQTALTSTFTPNWPTERKPCTMNARSTRYRRTSTQLFLFTTT